MYSYWTKYLVLVITFALTNSHDCRSQFSENWINHWHFGTASGINFSSGTAVNTASSILGTEVTSSWADGDGNNMFYVGANAASTGGLGSVIWDASHTQMPNGDINIDYSSSCGLAIAPMPGNCDKYYVFHLMSHGPGWGLAYSIIDMTLPGNGTIPSPLGDVEAANKDVMHYSSDNLAEKIKIIQKGVSEDFWVLTRSWTADVFYAFEVTSSGVAATPVTSTLSATTWATVAGSPLAGWLALDKDRSIIAEANTLSASVHVYPFNNLTGAVSVGETIYSGIVFSDIPYGVEFSPDGNVLYCDRYDNSGNAVISNWDMTAGIGSIATTLQNFVLVAGVDYGAIARAADGKIYGAQLISNTSLMTIETPNNYSAPGVTYSGHSLGGTACFIGIVNQAYYYHPDNFIDSLAGNDRMICPTEQATLGAIGADSIEAVYSWEPSALVVDDDNANTLTVPLSADQQYILALIHPCGDTIKLDTVMVTMCSVLPVSWLNVSANILPRGNQVIWKVGSEQNCDKYEIEVSINGKDFTRFASHKGAGNYSGELTYYITDQNISYGIFYYRIKQIDYDGNFSYSKIVSVTRNGSTGLSIYPNPSNGLVTIDLSDHLSTESQLIISDVAGKIIEQHTISGESAVVTLDISHYAKGTYLVSSTSNEYVKTSRLIKK